MDRKEEEIVPASEEGANEESVNEDGFTPKQVAYIASEDFIHERFPGGPD